MKKRSQIINILTFVQFLLGFLVVLEDLVEIPQIVQPIGRMHPLILHFPITLIIGLTVLEVVKKKITETYRQIQPVLLIFSTFITTLTAISGFFLYKEGGYTGNSLLIHKWAGISLSFILYAVVVYNKEGKITNAFYGLSLIVLLVTGHFGAGLTHGEDFLWEPLMVKASTTYDENSTVFSTAILPVFESKCQACHNPSKRKGELLLDSYGALMAGGENGPALIEGNAEESDMVKRILLELDHEDHMPPEGKPQLNDLEIDILKRWIKLGASETLLISEIPDNDTLKNIIPKLFSPLTETKSYDFDFANAELVKSLNTPFRTVKQSIYNNPALDVSIFVKSAWKKQNLSELEPISDQIVSLNLAYLPVKDEDLKFISGFQNLEKLVLNFTEISENGLKELSGLRHLEELSLAGIPLSSEIDNIIIHWPKLNKIYLWQSGLGRKEGETLKKKYPDINIDLGYIPSEDETLKLSIPLIVNRTTVLGSNDKIQLEHKLPGVKIHFTTDGSDPDSSSQVYDEPLPLKDIIKLKAMATKEGWQSSDLVEFGFFIKGFTPKNVTLLTKPNEQYRGMGAEGLVDNKKGDIENISSPLWLGYREEPFSALIDFGQNPPELQYITLGYGLNMGAYIMKPIKVEVYGGNSTTNLSKIKDIIPALPTTFEPNGEQALTLNFTKTTFRYYKIIAYTYKVLPDWHNGAG
ncbi:MAG: chitobiase/beta-hexosaminidase C-terminal domain-containing protein, partial [Cyclobacteriaceae bacterium]|nr:chitobiase/beta-hexosaminidase C-terminal domain-containing protein [Cyclobacteriaceae bacterium]